MLFVANPTDLLLTDATQQEAYDVGKQRLVLVRWLQQLQHVLIISTVGD